MRGRTKPADRRNDLLICRCKYADDFLASHELTYRNVIRDVYKEEDELLASGIDNPEPKFPDKGSRIKVAVLDTGLDVGHPDIEARAERIKDVRSWVNGLDGKQDRKAGDSCGHGTHVASLLLGVAPDCDIYIARIAEFDPTSPDQIAKVHPPQDPERLKAKINSDTGCHSRSDGMAGGHHLHVLRPLRRDRARLR
jgi:hypothetical protein